MKSRLALTMMLAVGLLMSFGGAGLAVTGLAGDDGASTSQYQSVGGSQEGDGGNGGEQPAGTAGETLGGGGSGGGNGPGTAGSSAGQSAEQTSQTGDDGSLPFTGFLAIPLLIGGVALAGTGAVMRRKLRDEA